MSPAELCFLPRQRNFTYCSRQRGKMGRGKGGEEKLERSGRGKHRSRHLWTMWPTFTLRQASLLKDFEQRLKRVLVIRTFARFLLTNYFPLSTSLPRHPVEQIRKFTFKVKAVATNDLVEVASRTENVHRWKVLLSLKARGYYSWSVWVVFQRVYISLSKGIEALRLL